MSSQEIFRVFPSARSVGRTRVNGLRFLSFVCKRARSCGGFAAGLTLSSSQ